MTGLYIHIPFCLRKCSYCDFYSLPMEDSLADDYTDAVIAVMESGRFAVREVDTLYFGGGTPSLMGVKRLDRILRAAGRSYGISPTAEITIEVNPATVAPGDFADLRSIGINRISVGVQSANDLELSLLGRLHNAKQARECVLAAYSRGFDNISADLMMAIPKQTMESLQASVDFLAELPVSHISAYLLSVEEGTGFYRQGIRPDEDLSAELYLECVRLMAEKDFCQYEVSNFAKSGMESRHNLKYWLGEPYLGIGPAAHSCLEGKRFSFRRDINGFLSDPFSILSEEGPAGGFTEYAMLRLRLSEGLDLVEAEMLFSSDTSAVLEKARPYIGAGLVRKSGDRLSLTPEGFLLSNTIIAAITD